MRTIEIGAAKAQPLFMDMDDEQVEHFLRFSSVHRYPQGTVLFEEGSAPDFLHVLVSGTVELFKRDRSRECGLGLLAPGDVFMPAAAVFREPYLNSARTLTSSRILLLRADVARQEFTCCHQFTRNVSRILAGQFRMATRHIIDLKCQDAPQRLASFLLRLVEESELPESANLPVPKRHLASRVGMTPETLSRTIQTLADNGLVVRGTKVLVRDRQKINAFCGPPPYPDPAETALKVNAF